MKKLIAILCLLAMCLGMVACGYEKSPIADVSLEVHEATAQMLKYLESEECSEALVEAVDAAGLGDDSDLDEVNAVIMQEVEKQLANVEVLCNRKADKDFFQKAVRPYAFGAAGYAWAFSDYWYFKLALAAILDSGTVKYSYEELEEMKNNRESVFYADFMSATTIEDLTFIKEGMTDETMLNLALYTMINVD